MSLIIRAVMICIVTLVGTGAFVYYFPETTAKIIIGGINTITDKKINLDLGALPAIPSPLVDIWDKNPVEENDYIVDIPLNPEKIDEGNIEILGRPKKIVEYYCQSDSQCMDYFKNPYAKCETSSGICYID